MVSKKLFAVLVTIASVGGLAQREPRYPQPTELPNPYRLVEGWPSLPKSMNGGRWGEVIRVHVDARGNVWVFHRCFNAYLQAQRRVSAEVRRIRQSSNSIHRASF